MMNSRPPQQKRYQNVIKSPKFKKLLIVLLFIVAIVEAFIIFQEKRLSEKVQAQTDKMLANFLQQSPSPSHRAGTDIFLQNVNFCWSKQVCITTPRLTATAKALNQSANITFDDITSYIINVHNADVFISPKTLEGMFNESVFNYPGSRLRNMTVGIQKSGRMNHIRLSGDLQYVLWIPFEMDTNLNVDTKTNTLMITVNTLKVFGVIPATWLIELKPFNLDKLLTIPPNRHLTVSHNLMMVKPFGLFPPPRINGKMSAIHVTPSMIQLQFEGQDPVFGENRPKVENYIFLQNGNAQFGNVKLLNPKVTVLDKDVNDPLRFSFPVYLQYLPQSEVHLEEDKSIVLKMPDHTLK